MDKKDKQNLKSVQDYNSRSKSTTLESTKRASVIKDRSVSDIMEKISGKTGSPVVQKPQGKSVGKLNPTLLNAMKVFQTGSGQNSPECPRSPKSQASRWELSSPLSVKSPELPSSPKFATSAKMFNSPIDAINLSSNILRSLKNVDSPILSPKGLRSPEYVNSPTLSPKVRHSHKVLESPPELSGFSISSLSNEKPSSDCDEKDKSADIGLSVDARVKAEELESDGKGNNSSSGSESEHAVKIRQASKKLESYDVKRRSLGELMAEIAQEVGLRGDDEEEEGNEELSEDKYKSELSFEISELNKQSNVERISKSFLQNLNGDPQSVDIPVSESKIVAPHLGNVASETIYGEESFDSKFLEDRLLSRNSTPSVHSTSEKGERNDSDVSQKAYTSVSVNFSPKPNRKVIVKEMIVENPGDQNHDEESMKKRDHIANTAPSDHVTDDLNGMSDQRREHTNEGLHLDKSEKDEFRKDLELALRARSQPNSDSDEEEYDSSFLNDRTYAIIAEHALRHGSEKYGFASDDLIDILSTIMEESEYHGSENVSLCGENEIGADDHMPSYFSGLNVDDALDVLQNSTPTATSEELCSKYLLNNMESMKEETAKRRLDLASPGISKTNGSSRSALKSSNSLRKDSDVVVKEYEALSQRVDEILRKFRHFNDPGALGIETNLKSSNPETRLDSAGGEENMQRGLQTCVYENSSYNFPKKDISVDVNESQSYERRDTGEHHSAQIDKSPKKKTIEEVIKAAEELLSEDDDMNVSRRIRKRKKARRFENRELKETENSTDEDDSVLSVIENKARQIILSESNQGKTDKYESSLQYTVSDRHIQNSSMLNDTESTGKKHHVKEEENTLKFSKEKDKNFSSFTNGSTANNSEDKVLSSVPNGSISSVSECTNMQPEKEKLEKDLSPGSSSFDELNSLAARLRTIKRNSITNVADELENGHHVLSFVKDDESNYQTKFVSPRNEYDISEGSAHLSNFFDEEIKHADVKTFKTGTTNSPPKPQSNATDSVWRDKTNLESPLDDTEENFSKEDRYRRRLSRRSFTEATLSPEFKKEFFSTENDSKLATTATTTTTTTTTGSGLTTPLRTKQLTENTTSYERTYDNTSLFHSPSDTSTLSTFSRYTPRLSKGNDTDNCYVSTSLSGRYEYGMNNSYDQDKELRKRSHRSSSCVPLGSDALTPTKSEYFEDSNETNFSNRMSSSLYSSYTSYGSANKKRSRLFLPEVRNSNESSGGHTGRRQRASSECRFSGSDLFNRSSYFGERRKYDASVFRIHHFDNKAVSNYLKSPVFDTFSSENSKTGDMATGENTGKINMDNFKESSGKLDAFLWRMHRKEIKERKNKAKKRVTSTRVSDQTREKHVKKQSSSRSRFSEVLADIFSSDLTSEPDKKKPDFDVSKESVESNNSKETKKDPPLRESKNTLCGTVSTSDESGLNLNEKKLGTDSSFIETGSKKEDPENYVRESTRAANEVKVTEIGKLGKSSPTTNGSCRNRFDGHTTAEEKHKDDFKKSPMTKKENEVFKPDILPESETGFTKNSTNDTWNKLTPTSPSSTTSETINGSLITTGIGAEKFSVKNSNTTATSRNVMSVGESARPLNKENSQLLSLTKPKVSEDKIREKQKTSPNFNTPFSSKTNDAHRDACIGKDETNGESLRKDDGQSKERTASKNNRVKKEDTGLEKTTFAKQDMLGKTGKGTQEITSTKNRKTSSSTTTLGKGNKAEMTEGKSPSSADKKDQQQAKSKPMKNNQQEKSTVSTKAENKKLGDKQMNLDKTESCDPSSVGKTSDTSRIPVFKTGKAISKSFADGNVPVAVAVGEEKSKLEQQPKSKLVKKIKQLWTHSKQDKGEDTTKGKQKMGTKTEKRAHEIDKKVSALQTSDQIKSSTKDLTKTPKSKQEDGEKPDIIAMSTSVNAKEAECQSESTQNQSEKMSHLPKVKSDSSQIIKRDKNVGSNDVKSVEQSSSEKDERREEDKHPQRKGVVKDLNVALLRKFSESSEEVKTLPERKGRETTSAQADSTSKSERSESHSRKEVTIQTTAVKDFQNISLEENSSQNNASEGKLLTKAMKELKVQQNINDATDMKTYQISLISKVNASTQTNTVARTKENGICSNSADASDLKQRTKSNENIKGNDEAALSHEKEDQERSKERGTKTIKEFVASNVESPETHLLKTKDNSESAKLSSSIKQEMLTMEERSQSTPYRGGGILTEALKRTENEALKVNSGKPISSDKNGLSTDESSKTEEINKQPGKQISNNKNNEKQLISVETKKNTPKEDADNTQHESKHENTGEVTHQTDSTNKKLSNIPKPTLKPDTVPCPQRADKSDQRNKSNSKTQSTSEIREIRNSPNKAKDIPPHNDSREKDMVLEIPTIKSAATSRSVRSNDKLVNDAYTESNTESKTANNNEKVMRKTTNNNDRERGDSVVTSPVIEKKTFHAHQSLVEKNKSASMPGKEISHSSVDKNYSSMNLGNEKETKIGSSKEDISKPTSNSDPQNDKQTANINHGPRNSSMMQEKRKLFKQTDNIASTEDHTEMKITELQTTKTFEIASGCEVPKNKQLFDSNTESNTKSNTASNSKSNIEFKSESNTESNTSKITEGYRKNSTQRCTESDAKRKITSNTGRKIGNNDDREASQVPNVKDEKRSNSAVSSPLINKKLPQLQSFDEKRCIDKAEKKPSQTHGEENAFSKVSVKEKEPRRGSSQGDDSSSSDKSKVLHKKSNVFNHGKADSHDGTKKTVKMESGDRASMTSETTGVQLVTEPILAALSKDQKKDQVDKTSVNATEMKLEEKSKSKVEVELKMSKKTEVKKNLKINKETREGDERQNIEKSATDEDAKRMKSLQIENKNDKNQKDAPKKKKLGNIEELKGKLSKLFSDKSVEEKSQKRGSTTKSEAKASTSFPKEDASHGSIELRENLDKKVTESKGNKSDSTPCTKSDGQTSMDQKGHASNMEKSGDKKQDAHVTETPKLESLGCREAPVTKSFVNGSSQQDKSMKVGMKEIPRKIETSTMKETTERCLQDTDETVVKTESQRKSKLGTSDYIEPSVNSKKSQQDTTTTSATTVALKQSKQPFSQTQAQTTTITDAERDIEKPKEEVMKQSGINTACDQTNLCTVSEIKAETKVTSSVRNVEERKNADKTTTKESSAVSKTEQNRRMLSDSDKSGNDSVFESDTLSEQSVVTIMNEPAIKVPGQKKERNKNDDDNMDKDVANALEKAERRLESVEDRESGYYSKLHVEDLERSQSLRDSVNDWLDRYVPMTREPSKAYEYKAIEEDFSLPSRTYIDHLTTYIPPRLPIEKPDLFTSSPESATLSWKPAKVPDRIRNTCNLTYTIEVRNPPGLDWRELVSGLTSTNYDLKNLHPRLDYLFRIRAHNEYGCSEPCLPVSLHRPIELSDEEYDEDWDDPYRITLGQLVPPKIPMEAPRVTDNGVTAHLSWLPARIPAYAKKTPITYVVEIKEPNIPGWSRLASGISDTNYFVEGLLPNKDYQFRIKAETQFGVSEPTLSVGLERSKLDHTAPLFDLDYYEIFRKDWMWPSSQKRPSLEPRREETDFDISTKPSISGVPPRMPSSRPLICHRHGNSVTLSWSPGRVPSYVKNSKMTYVVEMREPPSPLWRVLTDNLTDNEFDITTLNPSQDYMFRVRAKNEFGQSEPTLPASVIRDKDDYTPPYLSRSGSASPWTNRSRASSLERQRSFSLTDDDLDLYLNREKKPCPPEFKTPTEATQYGVENKPAKIVLNLRGFPLPRVSWFFMGEKLSYDDLFKASTSPAGIATLEIEKMTSGRVGDYKCYAENEQGVAVKIVRLLMADQPTILEPMRNLTLTSRGSGKLECRVVGTPLPTVKFLKDMRTVTGTNRLKVDHTPPDLWTLTLDGASSLDTGLYTCVAENIAGKVSSVAKVTVSDLDDDDEDKETVTMETSIRKELCEDHYYILEEIGRGRHGIVRRVVDKISGDEYAAKFISVSNDSQMQFFMHELRNLCSLNHKGVPRVIDLFQTERRLVIIMELITGGSLLSYIVRRKNQIEEDVAYYMEQLLLILKYLHGNHILHLDIKPTNVHLVDDGSDNICLLDFGFSRQYRKDKSTILNFGSRDFTSPEQINNEALSPATDLWNIGLLTYTLLSGKPPFHEETETETLLKIQNCDWSIDEEAFEGISAEAKDFITKLLVRNPEDRMTLTGCLNHPFIKGDCEEGQGQKLNTEGLKEYSKFLREMRLQTVVQTTANLTSIKQILERKSDELVIFRSEVKDTDHVTFPDSLAYGEFLDEESWFDWQSRVYGRIDDLDGQTEDDALTRDPILEKEREWQSVAEEYKQQTQKPQTFFPKEEDAENPQFLSKLHNQIFRQGQDLALTCRIVNSEGMSVSWFRNEELLSDGGRIKTSFSDDGVATLTVTAAKPYDDGLYKCTVQSKKGKSSTWARVIVGDVPSQSSRPIVTQISSRDALLLWESPVTDSDLDIQHYRVDYKEQEQEEWLIGAYSIDQIAMVTDLKPNTLYQFRVSAINDFGVGSYSVSSVPIKTLKEGAEDIELLPFETMVLSRQRYTAPSGRRTDLQIRELTLKEGNVDENFEFTDTLFRGRFSSYILTREKTNRTELVTRRIDQSESSTEDLKRELSVLRRLQLCDRFLQVYESYRYQEHFYFILEYFCGVNILEHFAFKTKYSEDMVAMAIRYVLDGVQFLHQEGIVHLNLNPDSIVMVSRSSQDLRITDFSLARILQSKEGEVVPVKGNKEFLAPEVVTGEKTSFSADIWSVGALVFLLFSGESPYKGEDTKTTFTNIAYNRFNPLALYDNVTKDAVKFIFKLLKRVSRNRMTAGECLDDRWLQGTDSIVHSRQEAVFSSVKLRTYLETSMTERKVESELPDLEDMKKLYTLPEEKRHRFKIPSRSFDADELEKQETKVTTKRDPDDKDPAKQQEKADEKIDDEETDADSKSSAKGTEETVAVDSTEKGGEKEADDVKAADDRIEGVADDIIKAAMTEALQSESVEPKEK